jgi:glycosyltransferase involved in cell wall biosynthesis
VKVFLDNTRSALSPHGGVGSVGIHFFLALKRYSRIVSPTFLHRRTAAVPRRNLQLLRARGCNPLRGYHPYLSLHLPLRGAILHSTYHKLPGLPFRTQILHVHDLWTTRRNPYQSARFQERRGRKLLELLRRADLFTVLSETVKEELIADAGIEDERIVVTGYGCPHELEVESGPAEGGEPRGAEPETEELVDAPYVLSVARVESRKNFEHTTRAVRHVDGLKLVAVGDLGFSGERIVQECFEPLAKEGRLLWLRRVEPSLLVRLYRNALAYLVPSWEEGFGITLLEAMSFGTPVITSNRSANREVVDYGGALVDPAHWEESSHWLEELLESPSLREELRRNARRRASDFRWEDVGKRLESLYGAVG